MNNPDGDPFKMFPPLQKVQNGMGYVGSEEGISHRKKKDALVDLHHFEGG